MQKPARSKGGFARASCMQTSTQSEYFLLSHLTGKNLSDRFPPFHQQRSGKASSNEANWQK